MRKATATKPRRAAPAAAAATAPAAKPDRPPTAFERQVYSACRRVPAGRVTTYGALAKALGNAPRAVGQALRRNPYAPEVPCHRVIASSLELGGFGGSWGAHRPLVQKKRRLLAEEGVECDGAGRVIDPGCVLHAAELAEALRQKSAS